MQNEKLMDIVFSDNENYNEVLDNPQLVSQQSTVLDDGTTAQVLTYKIEAVNELIAKNRVRRYVRTNNPTVKNIISPIVQDSNQTEQSRLQSFFPDTFEQFEYEVSVAVVL